MSRPIRNESKLLFFENMVKYRNSRILVVDDEEFCISTMRSYLSQLGVNVNSQVDFCINGEEAVN
jgi:CheY-like chemotaxis protein